MKNIGVQFVSGFFFGAGFVTAAIVIRLVFHVGMCT